MQIFSLRNFFLVILPTAAIAVFFSSQNTVFASEVKQDNWIATTTLSQPGNPYISKGENSLAPTWIWEPSRSQIPGTIHYLVQWCQQADFSTCQTNLMYTDSASFSFDNSNLLSNGTWYMRVRAVDEFGHKSAYSSTGSGTLNYYSLVTPYSFTANLVGNEAKLSWKDCWASNFQVWGSDTGIAGTFSPLGKTESYGFSSNLGTNPVRWFYVTAIDKWGNESPPSPVIRIQIPGLKQAENPGLGADLAEIFEPIWGGFSFDKGKVAGDRTDKVHDGVSYSSFSLGDFVPVDYFR